MDPEPQPSYSVLKSQIRLQSNNIENDYMCPLSLEIMIDPVVAADGHTYQRRQIQNWMKNNDVSPLTREVFINKNLTPNLTMRKAIITWKEGRTKFDLARDKFGSLIIEDKIRQDELKSVKEELELLKLKQQKAQDELGNKSQQVDISSQYKVNQLQRSEEPPNKSQQGDKQERKDFCISYKPIQKAQMDLNSQLCYQQRKKNRAMKIEMEKMRSEYEKQMFDKTKEQQIAYSKDGIYTGSIKNGLMNGYGVYQWQSQERYQGGFLDGKSHGYGKFYYPNNSMYMGTFKNGSKNGYGQFVYACDDRYLGSFQNDKFNGYGIYQCADGDRYLGSFKDGNKHGYGRYFYVSGDSYQGTYKEGKRHGYGIYNYYSGSRESRVYAESK